MCKKLEGLLFEEEQVDDDDSYRGLLKEEIVAVNDVLLEKEAIIKNLDAKIANLTMSQGSHVGGNSSENIALTSCTGTDVNKLTSVVTAAKTLH